MVRLELAADGPVVSSAGGLARGSQAAGCRYFASHRRSGPPDQAVAG